MKKLLRAIALLTMFIVSGWSVTSYANASPSIKENCGFRPCNPVQIPGAPSNLSVSFNRLTGATNLSWGASSPSATSYDIAKSYNGGSFSGFRGTTNRSVSFTVTEPGRYKFSVKGCVADNNGIVHCGTAVVSGVYELLAPEPPLAPSIQSLPTYSEASELTLRWSDTAVSYKVYSSNDAGKTWYLEGMTSTPSYSHFLNTTVGVKNCFRVSATDNNGGGYSHASSRCTILVEPPVIRGQSSLSFEEDGVLRLSLSDFTITKSHAIEQLKVLDGSNYSVSGREITPKNNWHGTLSVPVRAYDEVGFASNTFNASIVVRSVNDPPVVSGNPASEVSEGEYYEFSPNVSDVDSEVSFTVVGLPNFLALNNSTGRISGEVGYSAAGLYDNIVWCATDGMEERCRTFSLTVVNVNRRPELSITPLEQVTEGDTVSRVFSGSDPDNDELTWSLSNAPSWLELDVNGRRLKGAVSYFSSRQYENIKLCVSDGELSRCSSFSLSVKNVNRAPRVESITGLLPQYQAGATIDANVVADDADNEPLTYSLVGAPSWLSIDDSGGIAGHADGAIDSVSNFSVCATDPYDEQGCRSYVIEILAPIATPTLTLESESADELVLSWDTVEYATRYEIEQGRDEENWHTLIDTIFTRMVFMNEHEPSVFRVRSCHESACSEWSNVEQGIEQSVVYQHLDTLGTPVVTTDEEGQIIARRHYRAFGGLESGVPDKLGYTGHQFDADTDLVYMQARYYDPVIGRFYSNDPVGFKGVHSFNRYSYANNNPYKYIDPDGREVKLQWHEVSIAGIGSGKNHSLLTIIPNEPSHFNNAKRISSIGQLTNSQGQKYGTMGAGPNGSWNLESNYNRSSDAAEHTGGITITPPNGMSENDFVDNLMQLDANYQDNLEYSFDPNGSDTFNSNSYVSGLLNAAGVDMTNIKVPEGQGFDKPVPKEKFEKKQ